jgi:hypothetical protein
LFAFLSSILTGCGEAEQTPAAAIAEGEKAIAEAEKRIAKAEAASATAKAGAEAAEKDPVKQLEQLATALKRRRQVTLDHDSETKVVLTAQYYKADTPDTLKGHTSTVLSVSFSPGGTRIASGSHVKQSGCGTRRRARNSARSRDIRLVSTA